MDEQRSQAYVGLIEQLLSCLQGQESDLLQANSGLMDEGMLVVMGQYVAHLESQGDSKAQRLRSFAAQLAQAMEQAAAARAEAARRFLLETFQVVWENQGNPQQIYPVWEQQNTRFDANLLAVFPTIAAQFLQDNAEQQASIAAILVNFGNLICQFSWGTRWLNLELAISAYHQALHVIARDVMLVEWAQAMNNLANAYSIRIHGDRAQNIEQAITAYQQALQVRTREAMPIEWARSMSNLALAYAERIRGDRTQNVEKAITAYQKALQVIIQDNLPTEWAQAMNNLANAYSIRIHGDRAQNIEEAISAYQQALQIITQYNLPIEWARLMNNLANAYAERIHGDRTENIEEAISAYQQALQVRTRDNLPVEWATSTNNLATAYSIRIRGNWAQNLERAIDAYKASLEIFTPELLPNDCRRTAHLLGNLYSNQHSWSDALSNYQKALQSAELLYQSANLLDSKAAELAATVGLPRRTAYALARTGHLQQAVETLERGRARCLSESLDRDRANLTQLQQTHPELYVQYRKVTLQLRNLESQQRDLATSDQRHSITLTDLRDTAAALRDRLSQTLIQIREVEGYADFLSQPSYEDIRAALRPGNPLVYLVTTPNGGVALIVSADDPDVLWLDDLTETKLIDLLNQTWFAAYSQSQTNRQGWYEAINTVTRQLWDTLMGPLVQKLQSLNLTQATLIPTGYISLLPLHAAWIEDLSQPTGRRYALDLIHFTYAPNAQSHTAAMVIADRVQADSILAIDEPHHRILDIQIGEYKPVNPLPSSSKEVESAVSTFQNPSILRHDQATRAAVLDALPHATILHCSCHGTANLQEPLRSGLAMTGYGEDAILTLKDIFALNLAESGGLRLAILSACETGMIGTENADEAISLPTGLLQAGVAAVIASLWSVSDLSTMLLLTRFYHLWRQDGLELADALRAAQQWVRDTTNAEKAAYFRTALTAHPNINVSGSTADFLYKQMLLYRPDQRDFAHPFHWAAFSYTGV